MKKSLALLLSLSMLVCLATAGLAAEKKQEWKFTCSASMNTSWAGIGIDFGEMISEATDGAITVRVYPDDQLTAGNQSEGIQAVIDGSVDLSAHSNLIYSAFDQRLNVVSLPFLFDSFEDVDAKLDGEAGKAIGEVVESLGLHLLGIAENGFRYPTNNKRPITKMEDMKGLKLRVAGSALLNAAYGKWGANWGNANFSEVYTALQTGTYDGQENPLLSCESGSLSDVQKYMTCWTGVYDCIFFTINGELYKSLSPELQKIVDECGKKAVQIQREKVREENNLILKKWKEKGVEITELSPEAAAEFKKAAAPLYEEFADRLTPELIAVFTK